MSHLNIAEAVPLGYAMVARVAEDAGVRALMIKGPVSAELGLRSSYPKSVDVDVWVHPSDLDQFLQVLAGLGWSRRVTPTSSRITALHSVTVAHLRWPCEVDVHDRYPGYMAEAATVFDQMWSNRQSLLVAGQSVNTLSLDAAFATDALHLMRDGKSDAKQADLVERFRRLSSDGDLAALSEHACRTKSAASLAPVLTELGLAIDLDGIPVESILEWRLAIAGVGVPSLPTLVRLSKAPKRQWMPIIGRALLLTEPEIRSAYPTARAGRGGLMLARLTRVAKALWSLPQAIRLLRESREQRRSSCLLDT